MSFTYKGLFFSLLFIVLLLLLYYQLYSSKESHTAKATADHPLVSIDPRALFYNAYLSVILPNDGYIIKQSTPLIDVSSKKRIFKDLTGKKKSKLVLRYSYRDCDLCVNSVLEILKNKFPEYDNKILLLTDSYSERDFVIKAKHSDIKFNLYNLSEVKGLGMSIEGKSFPFLFLLTPSNSVEKIFIPFKEHPQQTEEYISYIERYL